MVKEFIISDAITVRPVNCPGKGRKDDIPLDDDGIQTCILDNEKCPYLNDTNINFTSNDKSLNCAISVE